MIIDESKLPGLYMLWPEARLVRQADLLAPFGYDVRTYRESDDADLVNLLAIDDEPMSREQWQDYKDKIVPNGLFLIYQTATNHLVATAGRWERICKQINWPCQPQEWPTKE
jgi:hypothetical protein